MASISFCFTLASRLILGHLFSVFISHVMFDLSPVIHSKGDQSWLFFGRTDAKAETPILWPSHAKSLLKFMSIELVIPSNHLILCHPLLLPHSIFPASGSFQISQFFASDGQSIGVSALASVLPVNIQD